MANHLDKAIAAYAAFEPNKIHDRVHALLKLEDLHRRQDDIAAAGSRHTEAFRLIHPENPDCQAAGLMWLEDATRLLAEHTQQPDDLPYLEAINECVPNEVLRGSMTDTLVQAWLRLGFPEEAERCLKANLERDPDWPRYSTDYAENLAQMGKLTDALIAVELNPDKKKYALTHITRLCFESGQTETARQMYLEAWDAYRNTQIDADGRAKDGISWNTDDCRNLIKLGELELLTQALRYVEGFMDPHPIDFWLELAEAFRNSGETTEARGILNGFASIVRGYDSPYDQAYKRIKLARLLRKLGFPCRAAAYIAAAQRNLGKLPARDKRYYLYDQLIRYHLDHSELREAQTLCRQARLWLLGKAPTETVESIKGYVESGLLSHYGQAGLTDELAELTGSLEAVSGESVALTLADVWIKSHAFAQGDTRARTLAEQAIEQIEEPYWRFEMWMMLINRTH
jgi:tetratricopeptide (TPR) repeat protein